MLNCCFVVSSCKKHDFLKCRMVEHRFLNSNSIHFDGSNRTELFIFQKSAWIIKNYNYFLQTPQHPM